MTSARVCLAHGNRTKNSCRPCLGIKLAWRGAVENAVMSRSDCSCRQAGDFSGTRIVLYKQDSWPALTQSLTALLVHGSACKATTCENHGLHTSQALRSFASVVFVWETNYRSSPQSGTRKGRTVLACVLKLRCPQVCRYYPSRRFARSPSPAICNADLDSTQTMRSKLRTSTGVRNVVQIAVLAPWQEFRLGSCSSLLNAQIRQCFAEASCPSASAERGAYLETCTEETSYWLDLMMFRADAV